MKQSNTGLLQFMKACKSEVEQRLDELVRPSRDDSARIYEAMRYSLLSGGKRLRAVLMIAVADVVFGSHAHVLDAACALEMIHAYSLIHDDLPCMDDDDLRRGMPTNHRVFGEAMAVLAGDGLLTLAFVTLAGMPISPPVTHDRLLRCIEEIGVGAGPEGMVRGQALDIARTGAADVSVDLLRSIHAAKTGALFLAAVRAAAILSGASDRVLSSLSAYARALGLVFQIRDDMLDVIGNEAALGKRVGSDYSKKKASYPAVFGMEESQRLMLEAVASGHEALAAEGLSNTLLSEILDYAATRDR